MVYLIGVRHEIQHNGIGCKKNQVKKLVKYLKAQIKQLNISIIAEEFSKEALKRTHTTISTAQLITQKLLIKHIFCDPDSVERKKLGILSDQEIAGKLHLGTIWTHDDVKKIDNEKRKYFKIRERFWLSKIRDSLQENMVFICGLDHLKSFQELLLNNQIEVMILDKIFI